MHVWILTQISNILRPTLQYETDSDFMRNKFEDFGEIKTFFDLIANRGMIFVTFVSSPVPPRRRAANSYVSSTCELQKEQETICRAQIFQGDQYDNHFTF